MPWLQAPFCLHSGTRGSWRQAPNSSSRCCSAQNHHKKKCLHHRRNCFSNSKGKTPGLMRLLHRILAGLFLPLPLPLDPLLFRVGLNQAQGAGDNMQRGTGSSDRMPRLSAGPISTPLRLQPPGQHGLRASPEMTEGTPFRPPMSSWAGADRSDAETEPGQARTRRPSPNPTLFLISCVSLGRCLCLSEL